MYDNKTLKMSLSKEIREELLSWKKRNKLNKQQCDVLLECYRRSNMFHNGRLDNKLAFLGLPSECNKSNEYVIPGYGWTIPRTISWYMLTTKGKEVITDLSSKIVWNISMNNELYIINSKIWTQKH